MGSKAERIFRRLGYENHKEEKMKSTRHLAKDLRVVKIGHIVRVLH